MVSTEILNVGGESSKSSQIHCQDPECRTSLLKISYNKQIKRLLL